jgi:uncharacterized protein (TIGR02145 family)
MKNRSCILKAAMFAALCLAQGVWAQVWNGAIDAEWYWDNTSQTEFTITTAAQLAGLAQLVNGGNNFSGKTIKLGANIVLNDTAKLKSWNEAKPANTWTPVGSYTDKKNNRPFSGTFDGGGHVVSGVYISNSNDYQGLFGYVGSGAAIKNLGVTASYVKGNEYVGGLAGYSNGGTITDSYTTGYVYGSNVGGLVGINYKGSTITNCYATGNVNGSTVGGLVGSNSGTITNSYATGNVSGSHDAYDPAVGGLVGSNSGTITNSYATGNVNGSTAGGLVGKNEAGTITNSYATGNVHGSSNTYAGGLVRNNNKRSKRTNCYATGNVNSSTVGGLVGSNSGTITDCYATGDVQGNTYVGGLVGSNSGTITDCYATGDVQGNKYVGGLVGENDYKGSTITNSYATGNVHGNDYYVGGLAGSNSGTITDCYATGDVQGNNYVGGLVGSNRGEKKKIFVKKTFSIGNKKYIADKKDKDDKKDEGYEQNGGIITNCYAVGKVTGAAGNTIGGLMGTSEDGAISNSYYDRQASGQSDIAKGEPKSTVQMKQQETFADWDFDKIWRANTDKNNGYPYLQFSESKTDTVKYKYPRKIQEGNVLTDKRDGKKYKTVIIGTQTWMAENLNYNAKGSKCYDNKPANCKEYGMIYNWATALKACPAGWHLPTNAEWEELYRYADLSANNQAGKYLKAKSGWSSNGTDEFGFTALPSIGFLEADGKFVKERNVNAVSWWSATEAYRWTIYENGSMDVAERDKNRGYMIRCIQD